MPWAPLSLSQSSCCYSQQVPSRCWRRTALRSATGFEWKVAAIQAMGRKTDGYQVQVNGFGRAVLPAWSVQICEVSHCKNIIKTQLQGNILILMWDNISFGQPNWQRRCKMAGLWTANFTPQFAAISKISLENLSLKKVFCKCRRFLHRFMLNMRLLVVWKTYCKLSTHHHLI